MTLRIHSKARFAIALVFSPLLGAINMMLPFIVTEGEPSGFLESIIEALTFAIFFGAIIGWPAMLIVGLPMHTLICKWDIRYSWVYAAFGAIAGAIGTFAFVSIVSGGLPAHTPGALRTSFFFGSPVGAIAAILFHLIRGPHKPLTPPSNTPT